MWLLCGRRLRRRLACEVDGGTAAGGDLVHLGELVPGAGEADFQALSFAEPPGFLGFGDAVGEVAADLGQAGTLAGVGAQQRAAQGPLTELTLMFGQVAAWFHRRAASLAA